MLTILLPAYNEEKDIGTLLDRICKSMAELKLPYQVVVVNDGSVDGTAREVLCRTSSMPLELINHEVNKGLGQAMLTGLIRTAQMGQDEDIVVTMDADNTHDPSLVGAMLAAVRQGADVVIASRYERGGEEIGLSRVRSFLSRGASTLLKIFFPMPGTKDYTCGYRAYRVAVLHRAFDRYQGQFVEERGFTCMAEILIKLRALSIRVTEVPLVLRYDLKTGPSKMKVMRTILRYGTLIYHNYNIK
jgi:dolichol-phosphate mannosyltransferase